MPKNKPQKNIPKGWQQVKLGDACNIVMGQSPSSSAYNENFIGIPLVQGNNDIKKGKTIERIYTSEITKTSVKDSIILTVRAPVGCVGVAHKRICIGRGVCSINTKKENQNFIFYFLKFFEPKWTSLEQGSTFTAVNSSDIRKLKLFLPSLSEQNRIVGVLETWDKYLERLTKKIEVKKKIKKGLMQKLLTGEVRLRGFGDEWEKKRLGDICEKGKSNVTANMLKTNQGKYSVYGASGFIKKIDFYTQDSPYIAIIKDGAGVGRLSLHKEKTSVLGTLNVIIPTKNTELNFLYSLLQRVYFKKYIVGSTIPHIYFKDYKIEKLQLPRLKEQQAIAEILTTADQEIEALEKKKNIIEAQKKYLLNNLITGKIRVPV